MEPDFRLSPDDLLALETQKFVHESDDAVFHLSGPGTIDCVQGILTNDVVKPGLQSLVWGAVLTPKGMIISDLWARRDGGEIWLIVPHAGRDAVRALLARSFPPRLTRVTDRSGDMAARYLLAPGHALADMPGAIFPSGPAPFTALLGRGAPETAALEADGWRRLPASWMAAQRLLHLWPTLGREIDEKTLVQEVRFDELQGVKYDKGCYTGQETVARLHFRGHANRELRRIVLEAPPESPELITDGKVTGRITTWGHLGHEIAALAIVRKPKEQTSTA